MKENNEVNYEIVKFTDVLEEDEMKKIICDTNNKNKMLKSIFVDRISLTQKFCYFVFEENLSDSKIEYDYLIVQLNKMNDSNDDFVKDMTKKLNELDYTDYKICMIFSDEDKIFLILVSELNKSYDEEDAFEL